MATTPTSTCPHWCEYHKNDPTKPDDFDHTARFTLDLALGRNSQFQSALDVKIIQASYGDGPGEIWFDCWTYSAAQARRLAAALLRAADLIDGHPECAPDELEPLDVERFL